MKSPAKIFLLAALMAAVTCLTISNISAQTALATWSCGPLVNGGGATPAPFTNNTATPGVIVGPIMKGPGIGAVTTGDAYGGNSWTNAGVADSEANSIANGLYITYTVQAAPGNLVSFTTNYMFVHASSTGPHNCELQYSTDGINYTDLSGLTIASGTTSTVWTNNLSTNSFLQNVSSTTTNFFRIVNWGSTASGGTWYIFDPLPAYATNVLGTNDFLISGTTTVEENLATWWCGPLVNGGGAAPAPFTNNTGAQGVIVYPITKGPGVGAVTTGDAYGGNSWTNAGIADNEADSIANGLYVTYAVQAATNYTISFNTNYTFVHASSTGPHNCELQYSTNGVNYTDLSGLTIASGTTSTVWTNNLSTNSFLQNVPSTVTNFFRVVNWGATASGGTWYIFDPLPAYATNVLGTNDFAISGGVTALQGFAPLGAPTNIVLNPSNITVNAGQLVQFTFTASGGTASNFWYDIIGSTTNLLSTSHILTLTNVVGANSGTYFVVLSNVSGSATSALDTLTVIDPVIQVEPSSAQGVVNGTVQFGVTVAGTAPISYQWYLSDTNGDIIAPATTLGDGSVISGATSSTLRFANLQPADVTNFIVIATNIYGAVTSSVASTLSGTNNPGFLPYNQGVLALWDFDGPQFTNVAVNPNCVLNPAPFIGYGTAQAVGSTYNPPTVESLAAIGNNTLQSPFSGATDPSDIGYDPTQNAYVFTPFGFEQPSPNFSWGTDNYPAVSGTNKANGIQFNVSTLGARNINISYDSRVSSTASEYDRLQYTTNGTTWIDYPASSTFSGLSGSGNAGYYTFMYSLVGFPGVDNNPNFGIRVVTEWQSTATYQTAATMANTNNLGVNGVYATNFWVGAANIYTSGDSGNSAAGTVTCDLVAVMGDAITNNNVPPTIGTISNIPVANGLAFTNMMDTNTLVLNFTASSPQMPASDLTFTVQPVSTIAAGHYNQTVSPTFSVVNVGSTNFQLSVSFAGAYIPDSLDAAPIQITATDTNGESVATWFLLTVSSINQPPTNTLTALHTTSLLVNTPITIPFIVGSTRNPSSNFTFTVASDNNTVIPAANIVFGGNTNTGNMTVTITPAANQVGNSVINVTVSDNDPVEPRSTTANVTVAVKPNTNILSEDYFNYDNSGSLDVIAAGYWTHLSGINGQLQANSAMTGGTATISDGNTENLQAQLFNGPYATNSGTVLYASFTVNVQQGFLPTGNGSYVTAFNDGSGNTANVEDCLVVATNGAAPGYYRLGVGNAVGATASSAQMFPVDLLPGSNYVVITSLVLSNGFSTLWINPTNHSDHSVIDTTPAASATNLYNIVDFELRESGSVEGVLNVGNILIGRSFNSVYYPALANPDGFGVTENTTNVLSPLINDAGWALSLVSVSPDTNGTATISGTNITFIPTNNFVGTATVGYTIQDNLGNISSSTITVTVTNWPPLALPVAYTVLPNSVNNMLNPLTDDVVETPGGSLSLVSVSETDGNGTATANGDQVSFTPASNFSGIATIGYTITDNLGGTNSSAIIVTVFNPTPIPLNVLKAGNASLVLSWTNSLYSLQYSTNVAGPYVAIPGATSPYTNLTSTNATGFFRLAH